MIECFLPLHPFHRLPIWMYIGWQHFFAQSNSIRFYQREYEGRIVLVYWLVQSNQNHHHHPISLISDMKYNHNTTYRYTWAEHDQFAIHQYHNVSRYDVAQCRHLIYESVRRGI